MTNCILSIILVLSRIINSLQSHSKVQIACQFAKKNQLDSQKQNQINQDSIQLI